MAELKTSRPFQERFLDGFDRHLGEEVQKVKPRRWRRKTVTWALGAGLALGGSLGIPMAAHLRAPAKSQPENSNRGPMPQQIEGDLQTARQIAQQVAGGVQGAVTQVAQTAVKAPQHVVQAAERIKQDFFTREVPFGSIIYQEAKRNDLPPELVAAVVHTESKFMPTARSQAGAIGLMQLVPRTGRWLGARDLTNPVQNITAGAKYLKYLTDRFDGNQDKAIAAYNAGEGNVRRFGGVPPFRETRDYVRRVHDFQRDLGDRLVGQMTDLQGTAPGL